MDIIDMKDDEDTNASGDESESEEKISRLAIPKQPIIRDVSYPNIAASSVNLMANDNDDRYVMFIA